MSYIPETHIGEFAWMNGCDLAYNKHHFLQVSNIKQKYVTEAH